jgi:hypothetical protein
MVSGGRGSGLFVRSFATAIVTAATLTACGTDCNRPPILIPALAIRVVDAESGAAICDAQVTIRHGDEAIPLAAACTYTGGSHAGLYDITIAKPGYQDQVVSDIRVTSDECAEAETKQVAVELVPNGA